MFYSRWTDNWKTHLSLLSTVCTSVTRIKPFADHDMIIQQVHFIVLWIFTCAFKTVKSHLCIQNSKKWRNPITSSCKLVVKNNIFRSSLNKHLFFRRFLKYTCCFVVPHSPPQNLQALFSTNRVYISWDRPKILSFQGIFSCYFSWTELWSFIKFWSSTFTAVEYSCWRSLYYTQIPLVISYGK